MSLSAIAIFSVAVLVIGSLFSLPPAPSSAGSISWTSDKVISDSQTYTGDIITLAGNLTINGTLTLIGSDLRLDCPSNGTYAIDVVSGGTFNILAGSRVQSTNASAHFLFRVWPNATLIMNASELHDCGWRLNYTLPPVSDRGLFINSSTASITNSTITGNNYGIQVESSSRVLICDDNISDNDGHGVVVTGGSDPVISNNDISYNGASGIVVDGGSNAMINHNVICWNFGNNSYWGGAITTSVSSPTITNNTILHNRGSGIDIDGGSPVVLCNNISGRNPPPSTQDTGIYCHNSTATIRNYNISANNIGIELWEGRCSVTDNMICNNIGITIAVGDGYGVLDGGSSFFANNTYSGNQCGICLNGGNSSFDNETMTGSSRAGVEEYGQSRPFRNNMTNCTFSNSQDILLRQIFGGGAGGTLTLINSGHRTASVSDPLATLTVKWFLKTRVVFENGSIPVNGAAVTIKNAGGHVAASPFTGSEGWTDMVLLEEYTRTGSGNNQKSPYNITAAKDGRSNHTMVALTHSESPEIILDDILPHLNITSPADKSLTNRTSIEVRGLAEPGATVQANGVPAAIDDNGRWTVTVQLASEGANEIIVEARDQTLNTIRAFLTVVRDTVAPFIDLTGPADGFLTNRSAMHVAGRVSDPSAVTAINGKPVLVETDGAFNMTFDLAEGPNTIILESRDAAQNAARIILTGEKDSIAPMLTVQNPKDGFATAADTVTIGGITEPGASLTINGRPVAVDAGRFSVVVTLGEGDNSFDIAAHDRAGNMNISTITVIKDSTPPLLVIDSPADGQLVNRSRLDIRGFIEPGVELRLNGENVAFEGSSFCVTVTLAEGPNTFTLDARDAHNNEIQKTLSVTADTVAPLLVLKSPLNGTLVNQTYLEVKGSTEPGASITINGLNATVGRDGAFSVPVELAEGPNVISVLTWDAALNDAMISVTVIRDTVLYCNITSPKDGEMVKTGSINVTGNAEQGATVKIGNVPVTPKTDGTFSLEVLLEYGSNGINLTIRDRAGNTVSKALTVTRLKPPKPTPSKGFIPGFETVLILAALALSTAIIVHRKR